MMNSFLLTSLLLLPLVGGLLMLALRLNDRWSRVTGLIFSLAAFVESLGLWFWFQPSQTGMQFVDRLPWIPAFNIHYVVGIDGLSILLVLLTTFLTPIVLISSWNSVTKNVRLYVFLMLLLESALIGVFTALDTFLFYVCWEIILIPMYFIIGIWGGKERIYASIKFFIYTMAGSLFMLIAILWLGYYASTLPGGTFTTDLLVLMSIAPSIPWNIQAWMFAAFALSFLIKVPAFPLHTWLPDAHVQAPTGGSVILAGVLLKMGTYGLVRFNMQLFPAVSLAWADAIIILGLIGIVYGALVSMVQTDIKKLVAYSSVSHMGFVLLGLFAMSVESMQGAVLQMVNHGLSTGALFLLVGMIYDRRHTRMIEDFGGLARIIPVFSTIFLIVSLSSIGLPGLNGFVGEFLILLGAFRSPILETPAYAIIAASGVILAAVYMLWMYQRVIFGVVTHEENRELKDLSKREFGLLLPILLFIFWIGVYPGTFLRITEPTIQSIVTQLQQVKSASVSLPTK